jgi:DNA-binding MarR family transcriptional regulator
MAMGDDDDVDIVIDAWAAALPDVDFAPLDVVSRLRRLVPHLQEVRRVSFAASKLRPWEFEFLSMLRQHGAEGMTPSMLAGRLHVTSGNLASQLDRLAARSLVVRQKNAADRQRVDEAMRRRVADENAMLSGLSRDQISVLIESLRVIGATLERGEGRG